MSTPTLEKMTSLDLQSHFFREKQMWRLDSDVVAGMNFLLGAHADVRFSPARALFLYQLKSLEALSYFAPVQAQDGAATLTAFFYQNPKPTSAEQTFLVPEKLKDFVPRAWRNQVFGYRNSAIASQKKQRHKIILIVSALDERQMSLQGLERWLSETAPEQNLTEVDVVVLPQKSIFPQDELMSHQMKLVLAVRNRWPQLKVKTLNDFSSCTLEESYFVDLNEHSYYYGHSSISDFFLQRGAQSLTDSGEEGESFLRIPLSFYHEMRMTKIVSDKPSLLEKNISVIKSSPILDREITSYRPQEISCKNLLVSSSLCDLAWQLARDINKNL